MKERPIIFNSDEVRAILDGRKTMMWRVIKPQPYEIAYRDRHENIESACFWRGEEHEDWPRPKDCPYGGPGDRLWIKETHIAYEQYHVYYFADSLDHSRDKEYGVTWTSPVRMPRWASRITLEIINVRVERVQDIVQRDVMCEGLSIIPSAHNKAFVTREDRIGKPQYVVQKLWDSVNTKLGYRWDDNPWVWVIEFKQVEATR